jgi:hypothetical protein
MPSRLNRSNLLNGISASTPVANVLMPDRDLNVAASDPRRSRGAGLARGGIAVTERRFDLKGQLGPT